MFGQRTVLFFEKAVIFLAAFAAVAFATIAFMQWSDPLKDFFFKTGRWEDYIILSVFVLGIGYVLRYLLKMVLHAETRPEMRYRRR